MRLWTLHPKYLDTRGLVALWREALLAQAVLQGRTAGYTRHPQLIRFRTSPSPVESIANYLQAVHTEAAGRGYRFDAAKIGSFGSIEPIPVTDGQLVYEWQHLKRKLLARDPLWLALWEPLARPEPHPLFCIVPGGVAEWEIVQVAK
ncbi:pyrimidine dimer DNA glycosylase/endonuclease V [Geobacter sp. SVR]|uniref:pyrimidine dimer DNA glycosylase/endonuclease V n=1 Tax=Geobacter sp. SVR TaxID=2495594 RepID=UPI00143EF506|nr:pyrimidine dimer DNA glycosylase/endonuclease V [Geobacter sp. SVR]BCS53403.1 pyrimidine dimer DNA glycosylase /DNA-(apurinic or apyrimidinic site) lyase [Geobacter sp. SVR]GCF85471.1 pyrimidine dimer DNA glycosylase /DNA-(apurinic or apyrimidinic site) lyase [Geobacter sp. SVR]